MAPRRAQVDEARDVAVALQIAVAVLGEEGVAPVPVVSLGPLFSAPPI